MSESSRQASHSPADSDLNGDIKEKPSLKMKGEDGSAANPASSINGGDDEEGEAGGDDLFGAGDDDDDDDEVVAKPTRQRRKIDSASPSQSPTAGDARKVKRQQVSNSVTPRASPTPSSKSAESYNALEHREISAEPPMGVRDANGAPVDIQEASFTLPSLSVRRGIPHYFARLPNLLQYRSEVFDADEFDAEKEDELLQSREGIRIDDKGLRSLLTTSNTIRWRWSGKVDEDGYRIPESNARIIKWDDGSSSLQLGSEFYDISLSTERVQSVQVKPASSQSQSKSTGLPLQPDQHLTHLFVKHDGQEQVNMYQSEAPISGTFTFRPTSTKSESHQRLAKAVRKQKGTLVKQTVVREDPELEKERKEKEEKKQSQKRMRDIKKKRKGKEDEDDDAFWDSAARSARRTGARTLDTSGIDGEIINGRGEADLEEAIDDDGFVVDDDLDDDDVDGEGSEEEDMEVDDEPDEMELMEAEMEKQEALRKAGRTVKVDEEVEGGNTPAAKVEEDDATTTTTRKKRVIDSDEE